MGTGDPAVNPIPQAITSGKRVIRTYENLVAHMHSTSGMKKAEEKKKLGEQRGISLPELTD